MVTAAAAPLIEAHGLTVFRNGADILHDVSFTLPAGELVMLVGPNGAGKSTLLNLIAGLALPDRGNIVLQCQATEAFSRADWAARVTLVPQLSSAGFPLTAEEVVELGGLAHSTSVVTLRQQVQQALHDWDIHWLASRDIRRLSGGEQQRCQQAKSK